MASKNGPRRGAGDAHSKRNNSAVGGSDPYKLNPRPTLQVGSFHPIEGEIVIQLRAAGWKVWDWHDQTTHDDDAAFYGTADLIIPRHSTAVRALRAACCGQPTPPPTQPEWWWLYIEGDGEFYHPDEMPNAMPVEVIARGPNFRIEQTVSRRLPPGHGWLHCPDEHPQIWRRWRTMARA
jgi:hypothetical protein